jgi:hypothetical protein
MNKRDSKRREEIGFKDMCFHEFGGLEIDEKLTNGYQLYIPYGIHCDIFEAIDRSLLLMGRSLDTMRDSQKDAEALGNETLIKLFEEQITQLEKHKEVLERIAPIADEI